MVTSLNPHEILRPLVNRAAHFTYRKGQMDKKLKNLISSIDWTEVYHTALLLAVLTLVAGIVHLIMSFLYMQGIL